MIAIKPIEPHQVAQARRVIVTVVETIYPSHRSIDETLQLFQDDNVLDDMVDVQAHYFDRQGLFLVVLDDDRIIGTGAVRKIDETICELKRVWLLPEYHGQGIGYRVIQMLFDFARTAGYKTVRLETGDKQTRAIKFYERVGFRHVAPFDDTDHDVFMEMDL